MDLQPKNADNKRVKSAYDALNIFNRTDLAVIGIGIALFWGLIGLNTPLELAHLTSFLTAAGLVLSITSWWQPDKDDNTLAPGWLPALISAFMALFLRAELLAFFLEKVMLSPAIAIAIVIPVILSGAVNWSAARLFFDPVRGGLPSKYANRNDGVSLNIEDKRLAPLKSCFPDTSNSKSKPHAAMS